MVSVDFAEIDREAERIVNEAKEKARLILREAEKKAAEIASRPFPKEEVEKEVRKILEEAEKRSLEIVKQAEVAIERLQDEYERNFSEALSYVLRVVARID